MAKSPRKEVGWGAVDLTPAGLRSDIFRGLPPRLDVFQWHEDMLHVPPGGELLATSEACPHQAFRYRNALGLQFHVEVTADMLAEWFAGSTELEAILGRHAEIRDALQESAERLYGNFLGLLR